MAILTDFEGRSIRFSEERWNHVTEHPEMASMRGAIEEALHEPDKVVESVSDASIRLYYRFYEHTIVGGKYLCVVVMCTDRDAFIITAYLTDRVKKGKVLWPRRS